MAPFHVPTMWYQVPVLSDTVESKFEQLAPPKLALFPLKRSATPSRQLAAVSGSALETMV